MSETANRSLYRRAVELLRPGDVDLRGVVVHTDLDRADEPLLHQTTLDLGDVVADHVTDAETYVYSGNDDADFGVNQHQGRTLDGDEFVWECQQLARDGTYDVVMYWAATGDFDAVLRDLRAAGHDAVAVTADGWGPDVEGDD